MTQPASEPPPRLSVGVDIHVGRSRQGKPNQDSLGTYKDHVNDPALLRAKGLLFVVADGMGGAAGGKEASETAVASIIQSFYDDPDSDLQASLERAIQAANTEIGQIGRADPELRGLGTTLVVVLVYGRQVLVANVGDSRVYLLRRGRLKQLSLDHTVVMEHLRAGLLSEEEAMTHPRRHVLSRNLGSRATAQPDYVWETLQLGDIVLLCSDGLWGPVSEYEIANLLAQDTQIAAESLIDRANAQGGPDNISAVVVRVDAWGAASDGKTTPITQTLNTQKLHPAAPATILLEDEQDDPPQRTPNAATTQPGTIDTALTQPVAVPPAPTDPRASSATQRMTPPVVAAQPSSTTKEQGARPRTQQAASTARLPVGAAPPAANGANRWLLPALLVGAVVILAIAAFALRPGSGGTAGTPPTAAAAAATNPVVVASAVVARETASATATIVPTPAIPPTVAIVPTETLPTEPTEITSIPAVVETSLVPVATVTLGPTLASGAIGGGPALTPQPTQPVTPTIALAPGVRPTPPTTATPPSTVDTNAVPATAQVVWSSDGTTAYSVGPNNQVLAWNAANGSSALQAVPTQAVEGAGYPGPPPRIEKTLSGSYNAGNLVRLRLADSGTVLSDTVRLGGAAFPPDVTLAAFSPDGAQVAYATSQGNIRLLSIDDGTEQPLGAAPQAIQRLVWSDDSSKLAVVSDALAIDVWDVATATVSQLTVTSQVRNVAFGSGGLQLAAIVGDSSVTMWLIDGPEQLMTFGNTSGVWTAIAMNGNKFALGSETGLGLLWQNPLANATEPTPLTPPADGTVVALAFAPDGATIAAVNDQGDVQFWPAP